MFIFRFFSSSANFLMTKTISKSKNDVYSALIRNSLFFIIYNQKEKLSGRATRFVFFIALITIAMMFYFYYVLFLLLIYLLVSLLGCLRLSLLIYLPIINFIKEMLVNYNWKSLQNHT